MAESSAFSTSPATRRWEKARSALAAWADLPRMSSASRFTLRGVVWMACTEAFASLSLSRRVCAFLPIALCHLGLDRLLVGDGMAVEIPGRRELAELMADHVLGHQHRQELVAVVNAEGKTHELRQDRRAPRPGLDHFVAARAAARLRLLQQIAVDERTLPNGACQGFPPSSYLPTRRRRRIMPSVFLLLRVFLPLVDLPQGVTG